VYKAPLLSADNLLSGSLTHPTFRVEYENNEQFIRLAMKVGIMADLKALVFSFLLNTCLNFESV
jgi:hypothetical protein